MSYSKGVCQHCGGHIAFPSEGAGQTISCPHCQWDTVLSVKRAPSVEISGGAASQKRVSIAFGIAAALVAVMGIVVLLFLKQTPPESQPPQQPVAVSTNITPAPPAKPVVEPDPWHGLKAGKISLEKSGDGRVVHAVGTVRNTSDHQRFGVKVELDVLDAQGKKIGSATDYAQMIEPGKEWKFKALVTDRNADSAKIAAIKEQE
ncbi:MAG TPA: FxLYD domain-containing protein [Verrucomicrobiae bacterium]